MKTERRQPPAVRIRVAQRSPRANWLTVGTFLLILLSLEPTINLNVSYEQATGWDVKFQLSCGAENIDQGEAAPKRRLQLPRSRFIRR